jgi:hypothetical protein
MTNICTATRKDGTPCQGNARPGKTLCPFHDPDLVEQRAAGRRAGGRAGTLKVAVLPADTTPPPLEKVQDVSRLLATVIHEVRTGQVDCKVANAVSLLAGNLLRSLGTGELETLKSEVDDLKRRLNVADQQQGTRQSAG